MSNLFFESVYAATDMLTMNDDLPSVADLTNSPNSSTRKNVTVGVDAGAEDGLAHTVLLPVLGSALLIIALSFLICRWYCRCCKLRSRAGLNGLETRREARRGRRIPTMAGGGSTTSSISASEIVCAATRAPQVELAEATGDSDRQTVAPVAVNSHHLEEAKRSHHLANVPSYTTDMNMGTAV